MRAPSACFRARCRCWRRLRCAPSACVSAPDILMPALYNPVHLAQSAALIDVLSRGRLILGVGAGYHKDYFAHFGIPIKQREGRFEETLQIVEKAWTTVGPFAHHGKYFNFDAIHVTPKPYQRPRPPLWIGAFGPKSIARAGRLSTPGRRRRFSTASRTSRPRSRFTARRRPRPAASPVSRCSATDGSRRAARKPSRRSDGCG